MSNQHGQESPIEALWMSMTGASAGHHEEVPGIDPKSIRVGHEPDEFNLRGIIYVPISVVITLIGTYLIVSGMFRYVNGTAAEQKDLPDLNNRLARISSSSPEPHEGTRVSQPRLEWLEQFDRTRPGESAPDPVYLRSFSPTDKSNNPKRIYPEDLIASQFVDPTTNKKVLAEYDWVVKEKLAQIPLEAAFQRLIAEKKLAHKEGSKAPSGTTENRPKLSNGGAVAK